MDSGRRSHEHGMPGDKHHDQHIGGTGKTHMAGAVAELHAQHPNATNMQGKERPKAMQHEAAPRGASPPARETGPSKSGVQQHPGKAAGKSSDPEG